MRRKSDILSFKFPSILAMLVLSLALTMSMIQHSTETTIKKQNTLRRTKTSSLNRSTFQKQKTFKSGARSGRG